jgi:tRNA (guanine-N(7)-)-methyltransferase
MNIDNENLPVSNRAVGNWLIRLREGEKPDFSPNNYYLFEAVGLTGLLYTLPELRHDFPTIFADPSLPLVLDVGCYLGHTAVELAKHNPGINVLGLDVKYKRVVKSCRKIKKEQLTNAKIAMCDVMELLPLLPEHSLYGMLIFFPDPWIKSRHHKFRYLNDEFFSDVFARLWEGGFIWLKTDHREYYEAVLDAAPQFGFTVGDCLPDKIEPRDYRTRFETIFLEQRVPLYQLICRKR